MKMKVHEDERGWLIEAFRNEFAKGQVYAFSIKPGKSRGKHFHKRKKEWFCVLEGSGTIKIAGKVHKIKAMEKVYIPPKSYHELKNTGRKLLVAVAYSSEKYNPKSPDTYWPEK
jgi:UDP-2-acetamido-2,6-beta-L-arabino-hexul-4-ose reductase